MIKKRTNLGQNFLKDTRALERIASVLGIGSEDIVVEIGPGHGELTRRILSYNPRRLIAVEKDSFLIEKFLEPLREKYPSLEIIEGDALLEVPKLADDPLGAEKYKLIGNIPYYITGQLLRILEGIKNRPTKAVFTLQKEVALRLCAEPPEMNLLAVSVRVWAKTRIVRYISKKSFRPAPQVDSAVVELIPNQNPVDPEYYKFIKALFSSPRKTVLNNLRSAGFSKEEVEGVFSALQIPPKARPQNLDMETIEKLFSLFTPKQSQRAL